MQIAFPNGTSSSFTSIHLPLGTSLSSSSAVSTGSLVLTSPHRFTIRWTWTSTQMAGTANATPITSDAIFGPTPLSSSSPSLVSGTSPPLSCTNRLDSSFRSLAFEPAKVAPRSSSSSRPTSIPATSCGVLATAKSRRLTFVVVSSSVLAEINDATSTSNGVPNPSSLSPYTAAGGNGAIASRIRRNASSTGNLAGQSGCPDLSPLPILAPSPFDGFVPPFVPVETAPMNLLLALLFLAPAPETPRVLAVWPAGLTEVRIAYDGPTDPNFPAPTSISLTADDRPDSPVIAHLRIAGTSRADDGRTLVLWTDPHPGDGLYRITGTPLSYRLHGVEAAWFPNPEPADDEQSEWSGWLPNLDLASARSSLQRSAPHAPLFDLLSRPGRLTLRTLVPLPNGESTASLRSSSLLQAELAFEPLALEPSPSGPFTAHRTADAFGEPSELFLTLPTGPDHPLPTLSVSVNAGPEPDPNAPAVSNFLLPWAPSLVTTTDPPAPLPPALLGGDAARGEALFFGDQAKCSACHKVGDRGGLVGPELSQIATKHDPAALFREIDSPSTVIAPEFLPYTLALTDGRVLAGLLRADGADSLRVLDTNAQSTLVPRPLVDEIRPSATSIMPVGLVGVIGEPGLRDLLAYLIRLK